MIALFGVLAALFGVPATGAVWILGTGARREWRAGVVGELAVSELATNAITHTKSGEPAGTFTVTVRPVPGGAEIAVYDAGGRGAPAVTDPGPDGQHGRGVAIVAALAASWGTAAAGSGRVTWCRIGGTS